MKHHFENLVRRASRIVRYWWLMGIAGLLCIVAGIAVFIFPVQSYVALSIILGILVLLVGASQLIIASSSNNYLAKKEYWIVGGVLDILLGIFLCIYPNVTMMLLPVMMGIWLMYHGFVTMAFGGNMADFGLSGATGTVFGGVLLLILSIMVLINPFGAGVDTVLVLTGVGLIVMGCLLCHRSIKLKNIHIELTID